MSRLKIVGLAAASFAIFGAIFLQALPTSANEISRISDLLDTRADATITAVLPNVNGFLEGLREGKAMRNFFDSPLGLHFLKSAPLRGAAHLHRLISLAPKSWQWNLYALITAGPIYYRSTGNHFTLVLKLNAKGKLFTSILSMAHAQKVGDWFIIASDKATLDSAVAYMAKPVANASPLDDKLKQPTSMSVHIKAKSKTVGLTRALLREFTGVDDGTSCILSFSPAAEAIGIEGECVLKHNVTSATKSEQIAAMPQAAYVYYRRSGDKVARILGLQGLTADSGYIVPRMFYSGPAADSKSIEFLSQAFKTRNHTSQNKNGALQILYPRSYASKNNKYDTFSPILSANSDRFYWHSISNPAQKENSASVAIDANYAWYLSVKPFELIKNSQEAIKQFYPVYSPGHFYEFRDALDKSLPTLKNSALTIYAKPSGSKISIGGSLQFGEN